MQFNSSTGGVTKIRDGRVWDVTEDKHRMSRMFVKPGTGWAVQTPVKLLLVPQPYWLSKSLLSKDHGFSVHVPALILSFF
jgi:hypothetical protein